MSVIEEHIKRINNKLQQVLRQTQILQKEKELLEKLIRDIKLSSEKEKEEIMQLQQQVYILKSSLGKMELTDKKDFEKQLSQYIKEIDKSINLLSE